MRAPIVALVAAALAVGCIGPEPSPSPVAADDATVPLADVASFLASLDLPTKPDASRATSDLETFTTDVAPLRHNSLAQHEAARAWLEDAFAAAGLQTHRHDFTAQNLLGFGTDVPGVNVLATLPGENPNRLIVIGAHYDGAESGIGAAYDDASGTMIVVELARALAEYEWNHTIVFAAWDYEESGLLGSAEYAKLLRDEGYDVALYVNFDMIGLNTPAKLFGVRESPVNTGFGGAGDARLAEMWQEVTAHLEWPEGSNNVDTGVTRGGSDHMSFLRADYPAVHFGALGGTNYPFYHTADTFDNLVVAAGGSRADLDAGFDAVLQATFRYAFVLDAYGNEAV